MYPASNEIKIRGSKPFLLDSCSLTDLDNVLRTPLWALWLHCRLPFRLQRACSRIFLDIAMTSSEPLAVTMTHSPSYERQPCCPDPRIFCKGDQERFSMSECRGSAHICNRETESTSRLGSLENVCCCCCYCVHTDVVRHLTYEIPDLLTHPLTELAQIDL